MLLTKEYNREFAVAYAKRWALSRNPLFFDFKGFGGDCTNFVSQCIYAGCCEMNFTPDYGWYYRSINDRSPAWTGVEFFYDFMINNRGIGPYCSEVSSIDLLPGDVVQLADAGGDLYHTLLVTGITRDDYLVSAHTNDALDRKLSTYQFASAKYLHIEGAKYDSNAQVNDNCFFRIYGGAEDSTEREVGEMPSTEAE
ncbi:MAG: amidase domain-containing protein [Clostridia bacterium]|nr:amidase domain-containing protein [Clostridia bacterium]